MSLKVRLIKDTMLYSAANYVAMAIGIVLSIVSKGVLGVVGAGYWAILKIALSYSGLADFGAKEAMLREYSQAMGSQNRPRAEMIVGSSFLFLCLTAAVFAAGIFLYSFFVQDAVLRTAFWALSALIIATQVYNFMLTFLRASKNIARLSGIILLNIGLVAVISIPWALKAGVMGFVLGTLAATVLSAAAAFAGCGMRLRFVWDGAQVWSLVKIGFPLVVAGYAMDTFLTLDAIMIGKLLGVRELGYYTIALMSVQQINSLGRFSQIILLPHAQEKYGRSNSLEDTKPLFLRTTRVLMYVLPVIIAAVYFFVPLVVGWFIPKFIPGLGAMKILVLGYFFVAVNELSATILFTINKQKVLVPLFSLMILAAAGLIYFFIRSGFGIEGVALATCIGYFLYFIVVFCYAFGFLLDKNELRRTVFRALTVFFYFSLVILNLEQWVGVESAEWAAAVKMLVFLLLFSPFLLHLEKKEKIFKAVMRVFFNKSEVLTGV